MQAILLIVAFVTILWGTVLALRGSLVAGGLAVLLAMCCFGEHFYRLDVAGVTLTADRLLLAGLLVAWLVQWRLGRIQFKPLHAADWILLVLIGVLTGSMLLHDWRTSSPDGVPIPQHLAVGYLMPLALYWIGRQASWNERNANAVLVALGVFGIYLAITGLLEVAGQWSLVFPRYIADADVGLHFGRARGPMVHAVSYGLYLATALLCLSLWRERLPWRWQILLIAAVAPLFAAALFYCKTRSVWIGAACGLMCVLALTLRGRVRVAVLGSMLAAGLLVGVTKMDAIVGLEREGTASDTRQSTDMRKSFAYTSWRMFQDRPLLGFGFGQYAREKLPYLSDRRVDLNLEQIRPYVHHNTYLAILTETGLVGLILLLAVQGCWLKGAWTLARADDAPAWQRRQGLLMIGVMAIAFWQMMAHEITFTPIDQSLIFLLAGMTLGISAPCRAGAAGGRLAVAGCQLAN